MSERTINALRKIAADSLWSRYWTKSPKENIDAALAFGARTFGGLNRMYKGVKQAVNSNGDLLDRTAGVYNAVLPGLDKAFPKAQEAMADALKDTAWAKSRTAPDPYRTTLRGWWRRNSHIINPLATLNPIRFGVNMVQAQERESAKDYPNLNMYPGLAGGSDAETDKFVSEELPFGGIGLVY